MLSQSCLGPVSQTPKAWLYAWPWSEKSVQGLDELQLEPLPPRQRGDQRHDLAAGLPPDHPQVAQTRRLCGFLPRHAHATLWMRVPPARFHAPPDGRPMQCVRKTQRAHPRERARRR